MSLGGWRYIAASVIGTSHEKECGVCQDAHACWVLSLPSGEDVLLAVAADGAGSASHGGDGAAKTCSSLLHSMREHLNAGNSVEQITKELAASWLLAIQQSLQDDASALLAERRDFACTLLALIVGDSCAVCLQVGDGVMVLSDTEEPSYGHVFWPDRGEYANTTHFVTQDDAVDHLQFTSVQRRVMEAALLTDGLQTVALNYQEQTAHQPFFKGLFPPL